MTYKVHFAQQSYLIQPLCVTIKGWLWNPLWINLPKLNWANLWSLWGEQEPVGPVLLHCLQTNHNVNNNTDN